MSYQTRGLEKYREVLFYLTRSSFFTFVYKLLPPLVLINTSISSSNRQNSATSNGQDRTLVITIVSDVSNYSNSRMTD